MLWSIFNQDIINNYNYINNEQIHNCFSGDWGLGIGDWAQSRKLW